MSVVQNSYVFSFSRKETSTLFSEQVGNSENLEFFCKIFNSPLVSRYFNIPLSRNFGSYNNETTKSSEGKMT